MRFIDLTKIYTHNSLKHPHLTKFHSNCLPSDKGEATMNILSQNLVRNIKDFSYYSNRSNKNISASVNLVRCLPSQYNIYSLSKYWCARCLLLKERQKDIIVCSR